MRDADCTKGTWTKFLRTIPVCMLTKDFDPLSLINISVSFRENTVKSFIYLNHTYVFSAFFYITGDCRVFQIEIEQKNNSKFDLQAVLELSLLCMFPVQR